MTDMIEHSEVQEETSNIDAVKSLDIAQLRKLAKFLNITAQRDWRAEDYVEAIKAKQAANALTQYVIDGSTGPAPGHARVLIHRDPTPGHKNSPIQVGLNGRIIHIPRGVEVDIPIPFVEVLNNAKTTQIVQTEGASAFNPAGTYKDQVSTSYPFQVIAATPGGKFENQYDQRSANYERRKAFHNMTGRWPTDGELKEAMKAKIIRDLK